MRNDNQNNDFIEDCKKIDFSVESRNKEKNLQILKTEIKNMKNERNVVMHKKSKKTVVLVAVMAALFTFSIAVYGQDLVRIVKTITLGDFAHYEVVEDLRTEFPIPENLIGQVFNKSGETMTVFSENGDTFLYDVDGNKSTIYIDDDNVAQITSLEKYEEMNSTETVKFTDIVEGKSYFITDALMPSYLPTGYSFSYISFYGASKEMLSTDKESIKYMEVYYSNGKNEIYSQVRFMDESTAFESVGSEDIQETTINGYDVVIDGKCLDIQIGDVMYMLFANDDVSMDEIKKMAESLE